MPELPEVEVLREQLQKTVVGKEIADVQILRKKSFQGDPKEIIGRKIKEVKRRAKILIMELGSKNNSTGKQNNKSAIYLLVHLKMTGQLVFKSSSKARGRIVGGHPTLDWVKKLPGKHTRVIIKFKDKTKLFFNDLRVFGWLKIVKGGENLNQELSNFIGIEPLTKEFTVKALSNLLQNKKKAIKLMLMDQKLIAGVGNIYANEALWEAKILPQRPAQSLTLKEVKNLHKSINKVIDLGIKYGGASESDYRQLSGLGGKYQEHFMVYKQDGKKCKRCLAIIKKMKLGGRGTYYCPKCQT